MTLTAIPEWSNLVLIAWATSKPLGIGLSVTEPAIVFSVGQQNERPVSLQAFEVLGGLKQGPHHGRFVPVAESR